MNEFHNAESPSAQQLSNGGGQYFNVSAYVSFVKNDDRAYYLACPEENCRRKVVEAECMGG
jgi:hypothetical protein